MRHLFFLGSESLAMAWLEQGDAAKATQVLDEASQLRGRRWPLHNGIFWPAVEWRRAQLYRQLGRHAEAEEIEANLRKLLTYADPDHRIRLALEQLPSSAGVSRSSQP